MKAEVTAIAIYLVAKGTRNHSDLLRSVASWMNVQVPAIIGQVTGCIRQRSGEKVNKHSLGDVYVVVVVVVN